MEQKAWTGVGNWGKEAEGTQSMCPLGLAVSSLGVGTSFGLQHLNSIYLAMDNKSIILMLFQLLEVLLVEIHSVVKNGKGYNE